MAITFYISGGVALICTLMAITRLNAVHALLYLIVSLLALAVAFYSLGAQFVAALEVIIYGGAIMVLFLFVIMLLNLGPHAKEQERSWFRGRMLMGPVLLATILFGELLYMFIRSAGPPAGIVVKPQAVGISLYTTYLVGVELASMLLLSGLVGAYHLGRRTLAEKRSEEGSE